MTFVVLKKKSASIYPVIISHAVFNIVMNITMFYGNVWTGIWEGFWN